MNIKIEINSPSLDLLCEELQRIVDKINFERSFECKRESKFTQTYITLNGKFQPYAVGTFDGNDDFVEYVSFHPSVSDVLKTYPNMDKDDIMEQCVSYIKYL